MLLFCSRLNLSQGLDFSPNIPNLCSGVLDLRWVQVIEPVEELPKVVCLHDPLRCFFRSNIGQ